MDIRQVKSAYCSLMMNEMCVRWSGLLLGQIGYRVVEANNGAEALSCLHGGTLTW